MPTTEVTIIGAGPAGLCAAVESAKAGAKTTLINEYVDPGANCRSRTKSSLGPVNAFTTKENTRR